ncbi:MAG TPA: hypothetical protein VHS79_16220 [Actinomycetes bacterium]|nr:hypothetical protein [Actinomycetes bacterium]
MGAWLARRPWVATAVAISGTVVVLALQAFGGSGSRRRVPDGLPHRDQQGGCGGRWESRRGAADHGGRAEHDQPDRGRRGRGRALGRGAADLGGDRSAE